MGEGEELNKKVVIGELSDKVVHFVLVHGIGNGAWCWYKIRCLMESSGYKVSCIDLKGAGIDPTDVDSIHSFDDYNRPLMDFMSSLPDNEKVILVGHSAGGLSVTQATTKFAPKIHAAVYVAATMLKWGFLTDQDLKDGVPDLSKFGDVYELGFGMGVDKPPTSAMVKKEFQRLIAYQMCPQEVLINVEEFFNILDSLSRIRKDSTLASMLLKRGPIYALTTARFTDDDDILDKVPRIYIRTSHDNVVKPAQQEAMIKRWPPSQVYVVDSDHSPFFSTPFVLFGVLIKVASLCF